MTEVGPSRISRIVTLYGGDTSPEAFVRIVPVTSLPHASMACVMVVTAAEDACKKRRERCWSAGGERASGLVSVFVPKGASVEDEVETEQLAKSGSLKSMRGCL